MDATETLLEIEAIKQLKARYCRFLDTKDWQAWRGIFADDFHSDTSPSGGKVIEGQWRITSSTLTRLRTDFFNPLFSVRISDRLTRAAAKLARR